MIHKCPAPVAFAAKRGPLRHVANRWLGATAISLAATAAVPALAEAPPIPTGPAAVSPVTVTPPSLVPEQRDNGFRIDIPDSGALTAPAGAEALRVTLGDVAVDGAFPELKARTDAIVAGLRHRQVSLAEVYAAASEIEAIHARAGYVLARVSVPPQQLAEGATLHIVVTDGFIESVDVSGLPARVQGAVRARTAKLAGKRHVTMAEIEQPLMLANDLPGLVLRSTLMRGAQPGGTKLVLEGSQHLVSGSLGTDNQLDRSLGRWDVNLQLALNSALGLGEQIYGFVSSDYDVSHLFDAQSRERVVGGGAIVPIGDGRFSINPEATLARTLPTPAYGAPQTEGWLRRLSLRLNETLVRSRHEQAGLSLTVEQVAESNKAPDFGVTISRDRYMAARLGGSIALVTPNGANYAATAQFSQGLGGLAAISAQDALANKVPFSRAGASTSFTKLTLGARAGWAIDQTFSFTLSARGQASFGKALFRAEQFSPEGADGLSAYVGGVTAVDEGAVVRSELSARLQSKTVAPVVSDLTPYLFSAFGAGRLDQPTTLERAKISAFNLGAGLRATLAGRVALSVEYARGISDEALLDKVNRISASATLRF